MHESSFEKMRAFRAVYCINASKRPIDILDVGSQTRQGDLSLRSLFCPPDFRYVGLDVVEGHNVDLVPKDPFRWAEIADESFDLVISNQMMEHNPFFWISAAEMARVLRQGGLVANIAPSGGHVHRHPLDCWRFYPDSWVSICAYVGLELVESYRERPSWRKIIPGTYWEDAMMVGRKPQFGDHRSRSAYYERIAAIVATRTEAPTHTESPARYPPHDDDSAWRRYDAVHSLRVSRIVLTRPFHLFQLFSKHLNRLKERRVPLALRRRVWARDGRLSLQRGEAEIDGYGEWFSG
jgi:SAM-dependent methyltransferase